MTFIVYTKHDLPEGCHTIERQWGEDIVILEIVRKIDKFTFECRIKEIPIEGRA